MSMQQFELTNFTEGRRRAAGGAALLALLLAGCGAESISPVPTPGPSCAELKAECAVDQKVCVESNGEGQCQACPSGQFATPEGVCGDLPGAAMKHDFASFDVKAGSEIRGLCQSWTLGNDDDLWINSVELTQDELSHHSIWTYVPEDQFTGPDGVWDCKERGYNELAGTLAGGVLYAQSTQATHEVQRFPTGAAVRIPAHSKIVGDIHLLNTTTADISGHASLILYSVPRDDVKVTLVPFEMAFRALKIPPHAKSSFSAQCDLTKDFMTSAGTPLDTKIYYILPHTHQHATRFYMNVYGGKSDGKSIIDVSGFNYEARGRFFDQPIDLSDAKGITFGCEYENQGNETLGWAYEQEMCQLLGFADSKAAFLSAVWESESVGEQSSMELFTGPCENTVVPWNFSKPGGAAP